MRGLTDKTARRWRERGTWSEALTLRFDPVQLGSAGTRYGPCPVLRTRPNPFDQHFRVTLFLPGKLVYKCKLTSLNKQMTEMGISVALKGFQSLTLDKYSYQTRSGKFVHSLSRRGKDFWQKKRI